MTASDLTQIMSEAAQQKRRERIAQRAQVGAALAFVVVCLIAIVALVLDVYFWRP